MMDMMNLITQIGTTGDCEIYPPSGSPIVKRGHVLPQDIVEFYSICGGVSLYKHSTYGVRIVSPTRLVLANPMICVGLTNEELVSTIPVTDISWSWYIIGEGESGQYITIDLAPERLGRCHDSFWEIHATPGKSPIVATSFTDLMLRLLAARGQHWYWLQTDFETLGDAYN